MILTGWGGYPGCDTRLAAPRDMDALAALMQAGGVIARGNGRAYGDSAVSRGTTVEMRHFNRMLAFDPGTGRLEAEAGVILGEIIAACLPQGWFPAVTPGTKFVTLGGMIAADVHGKNHHRHGSFGNFVDWIDLLGPDGIIRRCSRDENADLFGWTLGGMGLTGVILRAGIRLAPVPSAWIRQTTIPAPHLDAAMDLFEASLDATYSVAWIDCLSTGPAMGRSLLMLGEHAGVDELSPDRRALPFAWPRKAPRRVPVTPPAGLLNGLTVRAFNRLYYWNGARRAGTRLVDWDSYFYPLDAILGWNRIYGRKGFAQFQCALPMQSSRPGLRALLAEIGRAGAGSFLAVLKRFGAQDSPFSFPMLGYTLALDFPVTPRTLALLDRLDRITLDHGGRFYLAKDARMIAETLTRSDPRAGVFAGMRDAAGLRRTFRSSQSDRLGL